MEIFSHPLISNKLIFFLLFLNYFLFELNFFFLLVFQVSDKSKERLSLVCYFYKNKSSELLPIYVVAIHQIRKAKKTLDHNNVAMIKNSNRRLHQKSQNKKSNLITFNNRIISRETKVISGTHTLEVIGIKERTERWLGFG